MIETKLIHGDCLEKLKELPDCSVDSIVTDPPYGLSFMGKKWDYDVPSVEVWKECLRVLKPGGHLLAFAGTRTQHRMAVRIEDAGFEIRDMIAWVYGSGFPKSLDVSKAIDKAAGAEREVVGEKITGRANAPRSDGRNHVDCSGGQMTVDVTAPSTDAAKQWDGWGTALKPALEPITVARKPLIGTVAENVLEHGTGGLNIDGCRVEGKLDGDPLRFAKTNGGEFVAKFDSAPTVRAEGRWPANLIHDGSEEVLAGFPVTTSGSGNKSHPESNRYGGNALLPSQTKGDGRQWAGDSGSAARFFYCAKASKKDRDEGCEELEAQNNMRVNGPRESEEAKHATKRSNHHPTVKPTELMRYLCRLVTPPSGIVLDPFMGSGSTGKAAVIEGFNFIGIEREESYMEIAEARINPAKTPA
jgi:site-specific DNA-methyltransferase (adenine-specific)